MSNRWSNTGYVLCPWHGDTLTFERGETVVLSPSESPVVVAWFRCSAGGEAWGSWRDGFYLTDLTSRVHTIDAVVSA